MDEKLEAALDVVRALNKIRPVHSPEFSICEGHRMPFTFYRGTTPVYSSTDITQLMLLLHAFSTGYAVARKDSI
jgi:hypothetical protein